MSFKQTISAIVSNPLQHAKWLNTLSLMENTGARKISASEHKTNTTLIILKHAAEEHRHAYYLKKQIGKLGEELCITYEDDYLMAPYDSRFYLNKLDVEVCRYIKSTLNLSGSELKFAAYLLVTYAIEVRADELYPIYQDVLDETGSRITVKSIILEEEGHLEEMLNQLQNFSPDWKIFADKAVEFETKLFSDWVLALEKETKMSLI
jgi:rubrerythrin